MFFNIVNIVDLPLVFFLSLFHDLYLVHSELNFDKGIKKEFDKRGTLAASLTSLLYNHARIAQVFSNWNAATFEAFIWLTLSPSYREYSEAPSHDNAPHPPPAFGPHPLLLRLTPLGPVLASNQLTFAIRCRNYWPGKNIAAIGAKSRRWMTYDPG